MSQKKLTNPASGLRASGRPLTVQLNGLTTPTRPTRG